MAFERDQRVVTPTGREARVVSDLEGRAKCRYVGEVNGAREFVELPSRLLRVWPEGHSRPVLEATRPLALSAAERIVGFIRGLRGRGATAADLARGITSFHPVYLERTATELAEAGKLRISGSRPSGRGRPARVFDLPEAG